MGHKFNALFLIGMFLLGVTGGIPLYKTYSPVDWWFTSTDLQIPDFKNGDDPVITFSREIKAPFTGKWKVELHTEEGDLVENCQGSGENDYRVSPKRTMSVTLFDWWMDREACDLPAGRYYVDTTWRITPNNYPEKVHRRTSNIFTVSD